MYLACVPFVVVADCESCTRPIVTNLGSMEAGEEGLTRGTCFVARRLDVVVVAGLLWISWCVSGAAGFRVFFSFSFLRTHTACCTCERRPCLIYLSTSTGSGFEVFTREQDFGNFSEVRIIVPGMVSKHMGPPTETTNRI